MNITIQGVEITLTPDQLKQLDEAISKQNEPPKPTKEQRFWGLINGLSVKVDFEKYPDSIFFFNKEECWIDYDIKRATLWIRYDKIWSVFEREYQMVFDSIQTFIKHLVEEHFELKGVTPGRFRYPVRRLVEEHFELKEVTPKLTQPNGTGWVDEHFELKGVTPYGPHSSPPYEVEEYFRIIKPPINNEKR